MKKLSENKPKHNHNFTDWLKFILFAILMLAPILSITTRCLYVICNKNAKDSYSGTSSTTINYKYQTNEVNSIDDLILGNIYHFHMDNDTLDGQISIPNDFWLDMLFVNINYYDFTNYVLTYDDAILYSNVANGNIAVEFYCDQNLTGINFFLNFNSNNDYFIATYTNSLMDSEFTLDGDFIFYGVKNGTTLGQNFTIFSQSTYNEIDSVTITTDTLDNAFDYSISQLEQSTTFAWTKQTATYDVFNNMLTGLTIQNGILPLLLTYWMMLIVVYIIVDIIIKTFTFITHLING